MPRKRGPRSTAKSSVHQPDTSAPITSHSSTPDRASQPKRPEFPPLEPILEHATKPGPSVSPPPDARHLPRSTAQSSVHKPDTSAPITNSHSSTPDPASQPTTEFPSLRALLEHSTQPCPSLSVHPDNRPLPLNWTESDCFTLAHYMYANGKDYDDKVEWWRKIALHLPGKTVQELRLFCFLYMEAYGELPPDPEWISEGEEDITQLDTDTNKSVKWSTNPMIENPDLSSTPPPSDQAHLPRAEALVLRKYFEWTLEESRTLLDLIERNPSILITKGGSKKLARHFPGKKAYDVKRHIAMVQLAAVFMGALNSIPDWQRISVPAAKEAPACNVDKQASTPPAKADEAEEISDEMLGMLREPQGESCLDSPPTTSGRQHTRMMQSSSSKPSSSRTGRRGRHGKRKGKASRK